MSDLRVMIGVPFIRPHCSLFVRSLLFSEKPNVFFYNDLFGRPIDEARNYLAASFLETPGDYLAFIDNDATFHPGALLRLVGHGLPVVCGAMYTKTFPPKPTMGKYIGQGSDGKDYYRFTGVAREIVKTMRAAGMEEPRDNALMLDEPHVMDTEGGCGMHFTVIRRDVLEKLGTPWFIMQGATGAGEDFFFCKRAREAGFKIWADLSVQTGHALNEEQDVGVRELMFVARGLDVDEAFVDGADWGIG